MSYTLYQHQKQSVAFGLSNPRMFDMSDAGTGKTLTQIALFAERRKLGLAQRLLVIAPRSILMSAWGRDFNRFLPDVTVAIANAKNRDKAFAQQADVTITNTDAVTWIQKNIKSGVIDGINCIVIDESEHFKHHTSSRSIAVRKFIDQFDYRALLSATPADNGVCDYWNQAMLLDGGNILGNSFYAFRSAMCDITQTGAGGQRSEWTDRETSGAMVSMMLAPYVVRHRLEECIDIPPNTLIEVPYVLSPAERKAYAQMHKLGMTMLDNGELLSAINAGVVATKLRQIASGSAYSEDRSAQLISTERYELATELALQAPHSVIFFQWTHQLEGLEAVLKANKIRYGVIAGHVSDKERARVVDDYQKGFYRTVLIQPQSGAHGLTLTKGTRTVWVSPIYKAATFEQGNHRIYRNGQQEPTQTVVIVAENTIDKTVYRRMSDKHAAQLDIVSTMENYFKESLEHSDG